MRLMGGVVNVNIKVPKDSKISLVGSMINKIKVKDRTNVNKNGGCI